MNKENNDIINKLLLIGVYSACGPFTRHKKRIDMFIEDGN